jgi:hypothetical protein
MVTSAVRLCSPGATGAASAAMARDGEGAQIGCLGREGKESGEGQAQGVCAFHGQVFPDAGGQSPAMLDKG